MLENIAKSIYGEDSLIGKSAQYIGDLKNVRVVRRDGEYFCYTLDYNSNRINVSIDNGLVTEEWRG